MNLMQYWRDKEEPKLSAYLDIFRSLGPGLIVAVGFVDPGNWASNVAAGSEYGYQLLWVVTLSTIMLIILQHNAAHLGIVSGKCLSEASTAYMDRRLKNFILTTAMFAAVSTGLAELLGGAIALEMLFGIPLRGGAFLMLCLTLYLQFSHSYARVEKIIVFFVSVIGIAFMAEAGLVPVDWNAASRGWVTPSIPEGAMPVIMSVLGSVIMPHNLFLHSEVVQSQQFHLKGPVTIEKKLKTEYIDTIFSMGVGWAINSAIIFVAASAFFANGIAVDDLSQAGVLLTPLIGPLSADIFGIALLFAGIAASLTSSMAGGCIFAGMLGEPYDSADRHTRLGSLLTMIPAFLIILFISSPFEGLIWSQTFLSIQLPFTVFTLLYLTSSRKVMGRYANKGYTKILLWFIGILVTFFNLLLLQDLFFG